jgi:hypothetical protein
MAPLGRPLGQAESAKVGSSGCPCLSCGLEIQYGVANLVLVGEAALIVERAGWSPLRGGILAASRLASGPDIVR